MATISIPVPRLSKMFLGAIGVSVLLHAALLLTLGSIIVIQSQPPRAPMAFSEPASLEPPLLLEPELTEPDLDTSMPDADVDTTATHFDLSLAGDLSASAAMALPTVAPVIAASLSAPGLGGGAVSGNGDNPNGNGSGDRLAAGLRGKINIGTIFNTQVESANRANSRRAEENCRQVNHSRQNATAPRPKYKKLSAPLSLRGSL